MPGFEDQQFFTPGEPPSPHGDGGARRRMIVRGALAVAGIAVLALVAVFVKNLVSVGGEAEVMRVEDRITQALEECQDEDDVAACEARVRADVARDAAEPEACKGLSDAAYVNCITLIAQDETDAEACALLPDAARSSCEDDVTLAIALADEDYAGCGDLHDDARKEACQAQLLSIIVARGECAMHGIDTSLCSGREELDRVVAGGDPDGCASLPDTLRGECDDIFTSLDGDGDGLTLAQEHEHGTDADDADTDGDGYNDGTEVRSGYDPLQ